MSLEENKEIVRRFNDEAWNKGNVAVFDEYFSPVDFMEGGSQHGMKAFCLELRKFVPDFKMTILDMIAEGDMVATRWTWTGANIGPTFNPSLGGWGPPTGKPFTYRGISISKVVNGKIVSDMYESNWTDMLIQMGVNPKAAPDIS